MRYLEAVDGYDDYFMAAWPKGGEHALDLETMVLQTAPLGEAACVDGRAVRANGWDYTESEWAERAAADARARVDAALWDEPTGHYIDLP